MSDSTSPAPRSILVVDDEPYIGRIIQLKLESGPYAVDSDGTIAWSDDRPIVLFGAKDLVVVNTGALTLVMPRERAADLKKLLEKLPPELRDLA